MVSLGLLVVANPLKVGWLLQIIQNQVRKTLYIQLFPGWNRTESSFNSSEDKFPCNKYIAQLGHMVTGLYTQASAVCHDLDVRVLLGRSKDLSSGSNWNDIDRSIDVVYYEQSYGNSDDIQTFVSSCFGIKESPICKIFPLTADSGGLKEKQMSESAVKNVADCSSRESDCQFEHVVLGGTFDRLHNGHKELLSQAVIRCQSKLTVGVTDTSMLTSKVLHELIEPCDIRISNVKNFLMDVDSTLEYNIVPISDPFGPTKDDPTMNMIVVSAETLIGGEKVNDLRAKQGLSQLTVHCVELLEDLLPSRDTDVEDWKISSSSARMRLLGTRLREPQSKSDIPSKPYVIGLTGGIASGKSAVGERLAKLGAGVINCDLLGHEVYLPGTLGHSLIVQEFGQSILDADGKVDRRALGNIVFQDKVKLGRLNELVWPLILDLVEKRLDSMQREGTDVAVVEAAVLVKAGWHHRCHEVWATIVSPKEAIRRLQERNLLSEEEAKARLDAQPSNDCHVATATVVLSPSWSPELTQKQVDRAWQQLQTHLKFLHPAHRSKV